MIISSDSMIAFTLSTPGIRSKEYWKSVSEKDTGQETDNPNILAARIIKRGGPVTHKDVNAVLASQGHSVTEQELDQLKNIDFTLYSLMDIVIKQLKAMYPSTRNKPLIPKMTAIYTLINTVTGVLYVGSTQNLGERLRHYFKAHKGENIRTILRDIRNTGINLFQMRIFLIPEHLQELRLLLALEQYYILTLNPGNNDILVAGGSPGGMWLSEINSLATSIPLYLFLEGQLIYIFNSMNGITNNATSILRTSTNIIGNCLNTGTLLFNTFTLSRVNTSTGQPSLITLEELLVLLEKARIHARATRVSTKPRGGPRSGPESTTPAVKLTRCSDGAIFEFDNFNATRTWLLNNTGKNVSNDTILSPPVGTDVWSQDYL